MTFKNFTKKLICHACVYFSIIMLVYIMIAAFVNMGERLLLEAGRTVLFFFFSFLFSCANCIWSIKSISGGIRLTCHYLITTFSVYACFLLPANLRGSTTLVGVVIFSILYFAVMGIYAAISSKYRSNIEHSESYQKQFTKSAK